MAQCVRCRQGFFWECENSVPCNPGNSSASDVDSGTDILDTNSEANESTDEEESGDPFEGREVNTHNDHNLKDQQSTGRKRAAVMYPLHPDKDCDWKMKKNCGGGPKPIVGCINGKQQARHHGPDKNTLNNDRGNVHRICHNCHNRWHTENDEIYVWGTLQNQHEPVEASMAELGTNELYWATHKTVKANDDK